MSKYCRKCGVELSNDNAYLNQNNKIRSECKKCFQKCRTECNSYKKKVINVSGPSKTLTEQQIKELTHSYTTGQKKLSELSKDYNQKYDSLRKWLIKNNIEKPKKLNNILNAQKEIN